MGSRFRSHTQGQGVEKALERLKENMQGVISLPDLFNEAFMVEHTQFNNFQELLDASPLAGVAVDQLKDGFRTPEWNEFVNAHTRFADWGSMLKTAGTEELKRRLSRSTRVAGGGG